MGVNIPNVASVGVAVVPNMTGFEQGLSGGVTSAFKKLNPAVLGAAFGAVLIKGASEAIASASTLEQSIGGVESVFGSLSDRIHEFGQESAENVGLARSEFNNLALLTGALLKNMGVPLDEATDKTLVLTQRAADMAATFGGPVSKAFEAINSALKGEGDPIEAYGVKLSAAAVEARVLADNHGLLRKEITDAHKAQAIYQIILEQTADAAGQFGREAETASGQQERLNADLEDAKAEIGKGLLPLWVELVETGRDLVPVVSDIATGIVDLVEELKPLIEGLGWLIEKYTELKAQGREMEESDNALVRGWGAAIGKLGILSVLTGNYTGVAAAAAESVNDAGSAAEFMADAHKDDLIPALEESTGGLEDLGGAASGAVGPTSDLTGEAKRLADELGGAALEGEGLVAALLDLTNPLFGAINRATSLRDLVEEIDEATDTEPEGFRSAEEVAEYRQAVLELAASLELASQGAGGANQALTIMEELFGTSRSELVEWLGEFGIVVDEFGNLGTAITDGVVRGAGNLQRDLTASLEKQIAGTLAHLRDRFDIRSPSGVWERQLGVPFKEGLIEPTRTAGRELQAAVTAAVGQGLNQAFPRGPAPAPAVPMSPMGDTITIEEGAIQVHNALPERASESLQSLPLRMTLQGLVRR
jgi:Flp pilus assembly pilin Flp